MAISDFGVVPVTGFGLSPYPSGLAYGNGVWVAVGSQGQLSTATDPMGTWTSRTSSFGTNSIQAVAYGNGVWVAVGGSGKLATATDPTGTWTQRTSSFGTDSIQAVAYGNGVWVAVGTGGKLATATDPTATWTQRTSGSSQFLWCVAYGNGKWVVGGNSGNVTTASDPTGTWTLHASSPFTTAVYCCAYEPVQDIWVLGGSGTYDGIATATDPTGTWTQNANLNEYVGGVAYGDGAWVGINRLGDVITAANPTGAWTVVNHPYREGGTISQQTPVAYGNNTFAVFFNYGYQPLAVAKSGSWSVWTLVPTGDSSIGAFTDDLGGTTNIYAGIDEGMASPDAVGIKTPASTTSPRTAVFTLTDPPASFVPSGVVWIVLGIRAKQSGSVDDTVALAAKIATASVTLAADDSGGTLSNFATAPGTFPTSYTNIAWAGCRYVNAGATVQNWTDALLTITFTRTSSMAADSIAYFVDAVEAKVYYTPFKPGSEPIIRPRLPALQSRTW